jgi:late competence protein required for DNA uptake (superfamily II DNA/RNA helicase)
MKTSKAEITDEYTIRIVSGYVKCPECEHETKFEERVDEENVFYCKNCEIVYRGEL